MTENKGQKLADDFFGGVPFFEDTQMGYEKEAIIRGRNIVMTTCPKTGFHHFAEDSMGMEGFVREAMPIQELYTFAYGG